SVAGRLRVAGYSSWTNNYGLPQNVREESLQKMYCGTPAETMEAARNYNVSYLYFGFTEKSRFACLSSLESNPQLFLAYDRDGTRIFQVKKQ
ncbi:MAG TPA: hypothetical protein VI874_01800, partial [Candidatus Norongarragalinales archaeon]|nr:hypothetical protein [Candidatus Norongarragalinales archaeon]